MKEKVEEIWWKLPYMCDIATNRIVVPMYNMRRGTFDQVTFTKYYVGDVPVMWIYDEPGVFPESITARGHF